MCGLVGGIVLPGLPEHELFNIIQMTGTRGRDGFGVVVFRGDGKLLSRITNQAPLGVAASLEHLERAFPKEGAFGFMVHARAEPTTEFVSQKTSDDQQPFVSEDWIVAHNGTVANDKELAVSNKLITQSSVDSAVLPGLFNVFGGPWRALPEVVGSYAILAHSLLKSRLELDFAANYRPLYFAKHIPSGSMLLVSDSDAIAQAGTPRMQDWQIEAVPPYTAGVLTREYNGRVKIYTTPLVDAPNLRPKKKCLAVCSGGLDSTVAAWVMRDAGYEVTLLHFEYGCRATKAEGRVIRQLADIHFGGRLKLVPLGDLFTSIIGGSPLTGGQAINKAGDGVAGAEFAHEWVPARNLVMLSIATAIAEAGGFDTIALGINIEEAGAYPDNEAEFINRLNAVMPFAVGAHKSVKIVMPVGKLTKREIVRDGLKMGAPLGLTWSCYEDGNAHCGRCGPCYMRKNAFVQLGAVDPVFECALAD